MTKEISLLSDNDNNVLRECKNNKLTVSSVRYVTGHDECLYVTANLKIGSKIVGKLFDNVHGGGYEFNGEKVDSFINLCKKISNKLPKYDFCGNDVKNNITSIIHILIRDFEDKKSVKNNVVFICRKSLDKKFDGKKIKPIPKIESFEYKKETYHKDFDKHIKEFISKQTNYDEFEIINKRYL